MIEKDKSRLIEKAKAASARAYSPYSKFKVGAAVLDAEGEVHVGCNVENASYGMTSCAERNALAAAMASGVRDLIAILIYVPGPRLFEPCGACRQVMLELMPATASVFSICDHDENHWTVTDLLPQPFVLRAE